MRNKWDNPARPLHKLRVPVGCIIMDITLDGLFSFAFLKKHCKANFPLPSNNNIPFLEGSQIKEKSNYLRKDTCPSSKKPSQIS